MKDGGMMMTVGKVAGESDIATCMHTYACIVCINKQTDTHTYIHTCMHTYTHAHTYIHTRSIYTCMYACMEKKRQGRRLTNYMHMRMHPCACMVCRRTRIRVQCVHAYACVWRGQRMSGFTRADTHFVLSSWGAKCAPHTHIQKKTNDSHVHDHPHVCACGACTHASNPSHGPPTSTCCVCFSSLRRSSQP
jgi:hypothetical protein